MKIVYFSSSKLPSQAANSVHVTNMAEALAECGHDVHLIHEHRENASAREVFAFYGLQGRFSLCPVRRPALRYIGLLLYSVVGFVRYVRGSRAALVYSRDYLGALFAALAGYRTVFELHSMPDTKLTRWIFGLLSRQASLSALVTISAVLRDDVIRRYPSLSSSLLVAHDAANEHGDVVAKVLGDSGNLKLGYIGSLYPGKGVEMVFELARRMPSIEFHVVGGSDPLLAEWLERAAGLDNLIFHGHRPHAEVASYIAALDVLLLPNQRHVQAHSGKQDIGRWTSPLKMFEYMAAGKPIICSDLQVLKEVMRGGRNCLLCAPDNVEEWVGAIQTLVFDAKLRRRLGKQARIDFLRHYTWKRRATYLLGMLSE